MDAEGSSSQSLLVLASADLASGISKVRSAKTAPTATSILERKLTLPQPRPSPEGKSSPRQRTFVKPRAIMSYRGELPIAVGLEAAGWTALPSRSRA
jgi:hypothetical protein